ncbi:cysteine protease StiP family protein [Desulfosporosinus sp. PR]|uniref:cysteine protease StiP family protein n=1 Tax=Candidatus Desulfosporosinus nitrosoreducens TaxID=3401928 RepID=UPI0027E6FF87|nr:cysteine protease StiP family protein [Desulfosporosinus sp. PR]MDQ7096883.1 cysteine protease StiP family protein [Desulfosporosinus sp. PR]
MTARSHLQPIPAPLPMGCYKPQDVTFLLKNLNGLIQETDLKLREKIIQSGGHYSEMLPVEYEPSREYMALFYQALRENAFKVAEAVGIVAELILRRNGPQTVLVSLARAGTPVGVLIKRYLLEKKGFALPHYSISIIRGKGIDENALLYILQQHPEGKLQFIDGWTGKGAITKTLKEACAEFEAKYGYKLDSDLAVLADPGHCVQTFGTREDFLIPSACLNSTVSGLISRTVLRRDLMTDHDFHGARYYQELEGREVSNLFVDTVSAEFKRLQDERLVNLRPEDCRATWQGLKDLEQIREKYEVEDINLLKPGLGETTRVLLRRLPERVLINHPANPNLKHILLLAKDRGVPVELYPELTYASCGIIKQLS